MEDCYFSNRSVSDSAAGTAFSNRWVHCWQPYSAACWAPGPLRTLVPLRSFDTELMVRRSDLQDVFQILFLLESLHVCMLVLLFVCFPVRSIDFVCLFVVQCIVVMSIAILNPEHKYDTRTYPNFNLEYASTSVEKPFVKADQLFSIVAVHGLNGDCFRTWTDPKSKKLWLRDFLPKDLPGSRVMTFGYNAAFAFQNTTAGIKEHAKSLLNALISIRERDNVSRPPPVNSNITMIVSTRSNTDFVLDVKSHTPGCWWQ